MRRDWKTVLMLMDVTEQLAGHPNLKGLRDEAMQDLKELSEEKANLPVVAKPQEEELHPEFNPDGTVNETAPKITRRSL